MSAPRLELHSGKLRQNAETLVALLASRNIDLVGVTKATLGCPEIARIWVAAGVSALGDSRVQNMKRLRAAGVGATRTLIRTPMLSEAQEVVCCADSSCNTELVLIQALSAAAQKDNRLHGIVLMVELGDLREGILPSDLENMAWETLRSPNLRLQGIGSNFACRYGVAPSVGNMTELSRLADSLEKNLGCRLQTISGGNSSNLNWLLSGADPMRINSLRLGESLLLGREPLHRGRIEGTVTDAITLVAEVIECKLKPSAPTGDRGQSACGAPKPVIDRGPILQSILAIGQQDVDPQGLTPPPGCSIVGASSDHLIIEAGPTPLAIGSEVRFELNYGALVRAMTSPFVHKAWLRPNRRGRGEIADDFPLLALALTSASKHFEAVEMDTPGPAVPCTEARQSTL